MPPAALGAQRDLSWRTGEASLSYKEGKGRRPQTTTGLRVVSKTKQKKNCDGKLAF